MDRSYSLRKLILDRCGQDVRRCQGCQMCDGIPSSEMDISLTSLIQLVLLNDPEVLTSHTVWSEVVLQCAKDACKRELDLHAVLLTLRDEAVRRGFTPNVEVDQ